jgi:hypothetical protein
MRSWTWRTPLWCREFGADWAYTMDGSQIEN